MQQINLANDPAICDEVAERLGELRTAWATLLGKGPGRTSSVAAGHAGGTIRPGLMVSV